MNELIVESEISSHIFILRGKQVMLDRDLAKLYQVENRALNQAVRRNKDRFPDDFMFQLTKKEFENWKSQIVTSNSDIMGLRKMPYVFTEEGIYMLASILRSSIAAQTSIAIIRTFTKLREFSKHYNALSKQLIAIDRKHNKQYKELKKALDDLIATSEVADEKIMGFLK
ncbi:MAG: ORF6N domain-containing protein [Epsilonproteobacteria bacterium]|nr:MAG: ORF6N domain-containing protein [Campylobacterota bacterium]